MRHGETDWNAAQRLQGHTDTPLNETGMSQARAAAPRLAAHPIGHVVSSDLQRAVQTARVAAEHLGVAHLLDAELRERCFGVFEALTWPEIAQRHPELHAAYQADPTVSIPGAETLHALRERAWRAVQRAVHATPPGKEAL